MRRDAGSEFQRQAVSAAVAALIAHHALAQSDAAEHREAIKVEVTGSHIPRTEGESALPVQVITEEDIRRAGWTTTAEVMRHVAANFNGVNDQLAIGNGGNPGLASANLRGLGDGNTLVLLNGRRLANYAFLSGTVDLNSIPLAAMERVEILKDGASSIYGSDAIAGVVNFITRKDYHGIEVSVLAEVPQHMGGDRRQVTLTLGYGDLGKDRFNAFLVADWQKSDGIRARDRPFSRTGYLPGEGVNQLVPFAVFPANVRVGIRPGEGPIFGNPTYASGCAPPLSLPQTNDFGDRFCAYDAASQIDIVPPSERLSIVARAAWLVASGLEVFAEYTFARSSFDIKVAPTPVAGGFTNTGVDIRYPEGGPYYPTALAAEYGVSGDLIVNYRTVRLGPRSSSVETDAQRIVAGAQGEWRGWSYSAAFTHSETRSDEDLVAGYVSESRFREAMMTGLINPFGPHGADGDALEAGSAIVGNDRSAKGTSDQLDARASGEIIKLPAGPLSMAFGGEARRERLHDAASELLNSGDILGSSPLDPPQGASRRIWAAFAEVVAPVARGLEAQLSARHDHYSDFGGTTNPKVALRWQPVKGLLVRGSWGKGFRAPTLPDLFWLQSVGQTGGKDPLRCPYTRRLADCFGPYDVIFGGNPDLTPERSRQYGVGIVWEPTSAFTLGLDYWNIDKRNVIGAVDPDTSLTYIDVFGDSNIVRGPVDPAYPTLPGPIQTFIAYNQNVGDQQASGFDVSLSARSPATSIGRFKFTLDGTYVREWIDQLRGLAAVNSAGRFGPFGPIPRWRHYASLGWTHGPWDATLAQTFQTSYTDQNPDLSGNDRRVSSYEIWDLQGRYSGFRNTTLAVGIKNLFDRAPPLTNQTTFFQVGYDPTYGEPRGRTFYARLTYVFK